MFDAFQSECQRCYTARKLVPGQKTSTRAPAILLPILCVSACNPVGRVLTRGRVEGKLLSWQGAGLTC